MAKPLIILLSLLLFSLVTIGQEKVETLNEQLDHYQKNDLFNGTVLIAKGGEILISRSIGYASFEENIRLTADTPMPISSISKPFTALAILKLKEEGLVQIDDQVTNHIEDFPYPDITVRHLLNNTSGFKRSYKDDLYSIKEIVDFTTDKKPLPSFPPGTKYQYSNLGYSLLAAIVENASGMSFASFLEEEIFKKSGMQHTFLLTPENSQQTKANSYNEKNKLKEWHLTSYPGARGIYASAHDLLKWEQLLYTDELVNQNLIKESYESGVLNDGSTINYGYGWRKWKGIENLIFHGGDWVGSEALLLREIEQKWTIIILANRENQVSKWAQMDSILSALEIQN